MIGPQMEILIVGATGLLGREIVAKGLELGYRMRALIRAPADAQRFAGLPRDRLSFALGDLSDASSLAEACRGVDAVVSTATAMGGRPRPGDSVESVDRNGQLALLDAAERAAARHFVFVSFPNIPDLDFALQRAKREVESRLRGSRLGWTILQPTNFMEFWLHPQRGLDPWQGTAVVFGSGEARTNWISIQDVARFAVAACADGSFDGQVVPLGGPDALSQRQVLEIFTEVGGPTFEINSVPEEYFASELRNATAANDPLAEARAAIPLGTARGLAVSPAQAQALLPGKMLTVRDYATRLLGERNGCEEKEEDR